MNPTFDTKAKGQLSDMVTGQMVTVENWKLDRYKRNGSMMPGAKLLSGRYGVDLGKGWHGPEERREEHPTDDRMIGAAEEEAARERKVDLWSDSYPVPPLDVRKLKDKRSALA